MSKLDDITKYIRDGLSGYIGKPNSEDLKEHLARAIVELIDTAAKKFDDTWKEGLPKVGDLVEARRVDTGLLEPDDMSKPLFDGTSRFVLLYMMPGTPLLVLATEGRGSGNTRVMSMWSGDVGWMHVDCLRPYEP